MKQIQIIMVIFIMLSVTSCTKAENNEEISKEMTEITETENTEVNEKTVADKLNVTTSITQFKSADYSDSGKDNEKSEYKDPDKEKAFPENLSDEIFEFYKQAQGDFIPVTDESGNIPNSLIEIVEKSLIDREIPNLDSYSLEIDMDDFYESERKARHVYKYQLEGETFYLLIFDSGGSAGIANNYIYKEVNGELLEIDYWDSLDLDANVIEYEGNVYFIQSGFKYYSEYISGFYICKLTSNGIGDCILINLKPDEFIWKNIYEGEQSYTAVTEYVYIIKDDLMVTSRLDDIKIYVGDEAENFDKDKQQRLKLEDKNGIYYEIDFNNDGISEYVKKYYSYPNAGLRLVNENYKFLNNQVLSLGDFDMHGNKLLQVWFKEIEGKVFTFKLFLNSRYKYILNVSLIENIDVTQVQSYIIVPKCEFVIDSKAQYKYYN